MMRSDDSPRKIEYITISAAKKGGSVEQTILMPYKYWPAFRIHVIACANRYVVPPHKSGTHFKFQYDVSRRYSPSDVFRELQLYYDRNADVDDCNIKQLNAFPVVFDFLKDEGLCIESLELENYADAYSEDDSGILDDHSCCKDIVSLACAASTQFKLVLGITSGHMRKYTIGSDGNIGHLAKRFILFYKCNEDTPRDHISVCIE